MMITRLLSYVLGPPPASAAPRAMATSDGGTVITTAAELEAALRAGANSSAGVAVTPSTSLRSAAVFRCVTLRAGLVATLPMQMKRRVSDKQRVDATDAPMWKVLNRRPNRWQKPAQFKRMLQAHVILRGEAFAYKVRNARGQVIGLVPLHPDRVLPEQNDDLSMRYTWTPKKGGQQVFTQDEILHLYTLTLDGIRGVTPLTYAREAIGTSLAMAQHGATVFKNGANVSGVLKHKKQLSPEAHSRLKADMEEFRSGGARDGATIILEDDMDYKTIGLAAKDAQWIEARNFSVVEVCMFFGVPPHMVGYTEGNTNLGSSIDTQTQSYLTFSAEDDFVMWEEGVNVDCLDEATEFDLYMRINRNALVRGDIKSRNQAYKDGLQWGYLSPDEVRELEDMDPRADGRGGIYYDPPNTAGGNPNGGSDGTQGNPARNG